MRGRHGKGYRDDINLLITRQFNGGWEVLGIIRLMWNPFVSSLTGSVAVFELTQLALMSVALEQMATIIYSGDGLTNEYAEHWYQQKPGLTPMLIIYGKSNQASGIPDQFAGSNSGNIAMLTISRAQAGNEAVYYCFSLYGDGDDKQPTVTQEIGNQPKASPLVIMFLPSSEELQTNKATLMCLNNDFCPGALTVAWKRDGTTQPFKQTNKYMASSYLTLLSDEWKSHNSYTCQVTHEGNTMEKNVSPAQCSQVPDPTSPWSLKAQGRISPSTPTNPTLMPLPSKPSINILLFNQKTWSCLFSFTHFPYSLLPSLWVYTILGPRDKMGGNTPDIFLAVSFALKLHKIFYSKGMTLSRNTACIFSPIHSVLPVLVWNFSPPQSWEQALL
uniref:Ig-like domain-containing protein n=1 Tax=Marmota marmota marmota TaxID=9994 RepID=A0A8C6EP97_MARMA